MRRGERGTPCSVPTVGNSAQSCQVLRGPCCGERAPELSWSRGRAAQLSFPTLSLRRQRGCFQGTGSREPVWPGNLSGPAQSDPPVRRVRGWLTACTRSPPGTRASAGASGPPTLGASAPVEHGVPAGGRHRPTKFTHVRRSWLWGPRCSHIRTAAGVKGHMKPQWSGLNPSPSQP